MQFTSANHNATKFRQPIKLKEMYAAEAKREKTLA